MFIEHVLCNGCCPEIAFRDGVQGKRPECDPWVRKVLWRRSCQPAPVFLPGESHGQRSLAGCSAWGPKELDTTEQLTLSLSHRGGPQAPDLLVEGGRGPVGSRGRGSLDNACDFDVPAARSEAQLLQRRFPERLDFDFGSPETESKCHSVVFDFL